MHTDHRVKAARVSLHTGMWGSTRQAVGMGKNRVPGPVNVCQACRLTYPEPPPWGVTSFPRVRGARQAHRPEESGPQHLEAKQELQPAPTARLLPWLHLLTASPPSFACRPSCELYLPIGRHLLCRGPRPSRAQPATGLPKLPGLRPLVEKWLRPPQVHCSPAGWEVTPPPQQ